MGVQKLLNADRARWLSHLSAVWTQNAAMAVFTARLEHHMIDDSLLAYCREAARQTQARVQPTPIAGLVGRVLGVAPQQGFMAEAQALSAEAFGSMLELIAKSDGDPPAPTELRSAALPILQGAVPFPDALRVAQGVMAQLSGGIDMLVDLAQRAGIDPGPVVGSLVMVAAAVALPRQQLLDLLGMGPGASTGGGEFEDIIRNVEAIGPTDPGAAEKLLVRALELAAHSETPDDDIQALQGLLLLTDRLKLSEASLTASVERAGELVRQGQGGDPLAQIVSYLGQQVAIAGLADEFAQLLAEAGHQLLQGDLSPSMRIQLGISTALGWMRMGRVDLAGIILAGVARATSTPDEVLRVARAQADLLYDCLDRDGATDVVLAALHAASNADSSERFTTLLTLLTVWPEGREGRDPWFLQTRREAGRMPEPLKTGGLIQLAMVLRQQGLLSEAAELVASIDLATFRAAAGEEFATWIDDIEQWLREQPEALAAGQAPAPSGPLATAAGLGLTRQFVPAAEASLREAEQSLGRGFRVHAFDQLAAAGKFYQMAGENQKALESFDRAFAMFEHDVVYLPRASSVVRRLASWPEIYTRAALAALDIGDPLRAVDLAETGRSRAIGNRIGPSARWRPPSAPHDMWDRYAHAWRTAVARAVGELVDVDDAATGAGSNQAPTDLEAELDALRMQLLSEGVAPEELIPLATPVSAAEICTSIRDADRPTSVLYSIRLDDQTLRFVRITGDGAGEIVMSPDEQRTVLQACDAYVSALRKNLGRIADLIQQLAPELVRKVSEPLGHVLEQSLDGQAEGRLLWIPQGSLVALPLSACRCGEASLVDRAAVLVAPSLTLGASAVQADIGRPARTRSIRGRVEGSEPSTDGGDRLLSALAGVVADEVVPASFGEWNRAVNDLSLIHVTCHGVYDWDDPLESYLKLDFDLSVLDLFERGSLESDTLVLFGTCDSGTVAQGDVNEAIGVPTAMLTAGARAVVGAAWPVARAVAVTQCLQFLRGLAAGLASPEALQRASAWVRDASVDSVAQELRRIDHPLVRTEDFESLLKAAPTRKWFASPYLWASYVHWGGGWRIGKGTGRTKPASKAPARARATDKRRAKPASKAATRARATDKRRAKPASKAATRAPAKDKRRAKPASKGAPVPTRARSTPRPDVGDSLPTELVGQWMSGGFLYRFFPDGSYEYSGSMSAGAMTIASHEQGSAKVEGNGLTVKAEQKWFRQPDESVTTYTPDQLPPQTFLWRVERDLVGSVTLILTWSDGQESTYYRQ